MASALAGGLVCCNQNQSVYNYYVAVPGLFSLESLGPVRVIVQVLFSGIRFDTEDLIIYALGIGSSDLRYVYDPSAAVKTSHRYPK